MKADDGSVGCREGEVADFGTKTRFRFVHGSVDLTHPKLPLYCTENDQDILVICVHNGRFILKSEHVVRGFLR